MAAAMRRGAALAIFIALASSGCGSREEEGRGGRAEAAPEGEREGADAGQGESAPPEAAAAGYAFAAWEAWEDAIASGMREEIEARYADDAELVVGNGRTIEGSSRIARYHALRRSGIPDLEREALASAAREGEVAVVAAVRGTHGGEVMGVEGTGSDLYRVELARFHVAGNGTITRHEIYADALNLSAQMGQTDVEARDPRAAPAAGARPDIVEATAAAEESTLEVADAFFEAMAARDAERVGALFAEDAALYDAAAPSDIEGRRGIRRHIREHWSAFSDLEHRDIELWAARSFAVATSRLAGTHDGQWRRLGASSSEGTFEIPAAFALAIDEGSIQRAWWIYDGLAIADAIDSDAED